MNFYSGAELPVLLEQAIKEFSERDFLSANESFGRICRQYPDNWSARYFHAMSLCSIGDFNDAREQLTFISKNTDDYIWIQVAKSGRALVDHKEQSLRDSFAGLL